MDTAEAKYTTTMKDLPEQVIEIILSFILFRVDRKSSRSVCKLWRDLINCDSSSEKYVLSPQKMNLMNRKVLHEFKILAPEFLSYNRRKISFYFSGINFENTEEYWIEKGTHIIKLIFHLCTNIPIEEILKCCNHMQEIELIITSDINVIQGNFIEMMEEFTRKGITNSSVTWMHIVMVFHIEKQEMYNLIQSVSRIFPSLNTLELHADKLYGLNELEPISQSLKNYNFRILLRCLDEGRICWEVAFNVSSDVPISLLYLAVLYNNHAHNNVDYILNFMSNYYYEDLNTFRITCYTIIKFQKFEYLMSNSSLKYLAICGDHVRIIGTRPIKNQLKELYLGSVIQSPTTLVQIGKNFVNSFQKLESLKVFTLSFTSFTKIINGLTAMTLLAIFYVIPDEIEEYPPNDVTLSNERLIILEVPRAYFIQTAHKCLYNLPNLESLLLTNINATSSLFEQDCQEWNRNIDRNDLVCMNCPKLSFLQIHLVESLAQKDHEEYIRWIKNILALFPNIKRFNFLHNNFVHEESLTINDDELIILLKNNPKLEFISGFRNISFRIAAMKYLR